MRPKFESTQTLLDQPYLRDTYVDVLREQLAHLVPSEPFPLLVRLPGRAHPAYFFSLLATMDDTDGVRALLNVRVAHMRARCAMTEEKARVVDWGLRRMEMMLSSTHGQASHRAHARVDHLITEGRQSRRYARLYQRDYPLEEVLLSRADKGPELSAQLDRKLTRKANTKEETAIDYGIGTDQDTLDIALGVGSASALKQVVEQHIARHAKRTGNAEPTLQARQEVGDGLIRRLARAGKRAMDLVEPYERHALRRHLEQRSRMVRAICRARDPERPPEKYWQQVTLFGNADNGLNLN